METRQQPVPESCQKCGTRLASTGQGRLCPRCLMAEGLVDDPPSASDTARFLNPYFHASFGDYELLHEVARGGMGVIYKARQRSLDRIVAIKVLASGEFASPEYVRRFRAEAEAAAQLQHPNIVAVHEVGEQEGVRYFSMDFVDGPNLAQFMGGHPLVPDLAAKHLKTLAEAIHYAHQQGILHRDLKPSNVLVDPFGEPRVTDFGLARVLAGDSDLTVTGQVLGTPGFLPPEQADTSHGQLTPAADVYSLGAVLYYMLTARAPFVSGSLRETLRQVLEEEPVAPSLLNPEVTRDLETICLKCLQRDPGRRYQSAAALAEDLRRYLAHEPIVARPITPLGRFARWCHRRPALAAVWFLSILMAVGSTLSALWIARARSNTEAALVQTRVAESRSRERLREARLAEARAVRRTTVPGRRAQALAALAEAAQVRIDPELRNEALAVLLLPDVQVLARWDLKPGAPASVTFDPSGTLAALQLPNATGSELGPATLLRWGQDQPLGHVGVSGTNRLIGPVRFSPDSSRIMARCLDATLRLWRVGELEPFVVISNRPLPGGMVLSEAFNDDYDFSPDGTQFVLGLPDKGLSLFRTTDGAELRHGAANEKFSKVRFSPDGRHVAAARTTKNDVRQVFVFRVPQLTVAHVLAVKEAPESLAWSSDGRVLGVSSDDNTVSLFDMRDGRLFKTLACPEMGQGELMFLGEDNLIGVRGAGTALRLVNAGLGQEELVIEGYGRSPLSAWREGKSFVVTSVEAVATRWQVEPPVGFRVLPPPRPVGYEMGINGCCLDFTPDAAWVVSTHGRYMVLRQVASGRLADEMDAGDPNGMEFSMVAFCEDGRHLLRQSSLTGLWRCPVEFGPDGWPHFGRPQILDPEAGFQMTDHLPGGKRLVLVDPDRGRVKLVEMSPDGAKVLSRWETPSAYAGSFNPAADTVLLNCSGTGTNPPPPRLHRVVDGSVIRELPAAPSCDVAWCANGTLALTSNGQKQSLLWDTATWLPAATLEGPLGGDLTTFALAPDGSYGVINRDASLYLVSLAKGSILARLEIPGASGTCAGIRFLPDGRCFAVLWREGRIDIIDPAALRQGLKAIGLDW